MIDGHNMFKIIVIMAVHASGFLGGTFSPLRYCLFASSFVFVPVEFV